MSIESLDNHLPSPIQELKSDWLVEKNVRLLVKRDDLLRIDEQSAFCGNKWRKLKYNLKEARRRGLSTLLTFGGAFSNHLAAVAEAGKVFDFQTIGIVRGEEVMPLNPTLQFCLNCGMHLHYIDRTTYRQKNEPAFIEWLGQQFGEFYLIPEGGTNVLALKGCAEIVKEIENQSDNTLPDYFAVACGTGGTLAGLVVGLDGRREAIGVSVLKGDFLQKEVTSSIEGVISDNAYQEMTPGKPDVTSAHWHIQTNYHFGGYAKFNPDLLQFIYQFKSKFDIPLDPIYTGKLFFGLFDLIQKDFFPSGSTILALHTGGLQGIAGFNARHHLEL